MNSVAKLEAVERLIKYSGLEQAKAKEYLERKSPLHSLF